MYRCIVVGMDGSAASEGAFRIACGLLDPDGGRLVLVHAVDALEVGRLSPWVRYAYGRHVQAVARDTLVEVEAAETYLDERAASLPAGCQATPVVRVGDAARVIAAVAREVGAELIVLATHGRTGIPRLALGSVADGVVSAAPAPVLLVGPSVRTAATAAAAATVAPLA